jgi:hypothetical protein
MRASERRQEGEGEDITDFLRGAGGDQRETALPAGLSSISPLPSPAGPEREAERAWPGAAPQRSAPTEPGEDFVSPPRVAPTRQSSGGELRDVPSKGARIAASIATGIEGQLRERAFLSQSPPPVPGRGPGGNALINTFRSRS